MTMSPNSLTTTPPFSIWTSLVKISRMALLLALISIAQIPKTTGSSSSRGSFLSFPKSEGAKKDLPTLSDSAFFEVGLNGEMARPKEAPA